jgi:hypothetical protein
MLGLRIVSVLLCLWAALAPPRARADPATDAFHADMAAAYRHYREAVHYLENDNPELAALALEAFRGAWEDVVRRYAGAPPPGYARDAQFNDTLATVRAAAELAAKQIGRSAASVALQTLRQIQARLAHQRARNGQRTYSDCIEPMNAAMDRLWAFRRAPPSPDKPESVVRYRAAVQETARWYRRCRDEAPAGYRVAPDFARLFEGALASLAKLEAVDPAHADALVSILRELHSFDRLIWLRFG